MPKGIKKSVDERLDDSLGLSDDIINQYEQAEPITIDNPPIEGEIDRVISVRRERGLAPRQAKVSNSHQGDLDTDYSYARDNLYNLIERGNDALEGILELAKEMEHPRAYEVASGLIKNVSDTTMELLKMQKELKLMREGEAPKTNVNNLYVGSTKDLQDMLKGKTITDDTKP
mgnify:FL=1|tara:strand:+ start:108 stop:626 length:519 start_codon:yes stop_codon:yes gene_type:complete